MDQLKEVLGVLRRQHFWFIAPILLIVGLVGWMMANKRLTQEYEANKTKVQSYLSQMQSVSSQQPHPNPDYEAGMEQLIAQRRDNVRAAWERKWERQKQELKWPDDLPAEFVSIVDQMRPIEKVDVDRRPIPSLMRRTYQGFIKKMLPRLANRIGAKWEPSSMGRFGGFDGGGFRSEPRREPTEGIGEARAVEEEPILVLWDPRNQGLIDQRFDWGDNPPSTLEVLYAQEDLWVLTTLIEIIQRTNGDAMIRSQAAIKAIDYIQIGKDVTPPSQQGFKVIRPEPLGGEDSAADDSVAAAAEEPPVFGPDIIEGAAEPGVEGAALPDNIKLELVKNRYYDENYEPIADLQSSLVTVAKRIPVRMRLLMDQRKINALLVECANAPLTFEVRQLRFNPQGVTRSSLNEGMPSEGGFFSRSQAVKTLDDYQSLDRTVELFGIIYIFNPVDEAVLGGEARPVVAAADDTAALDSIDRRLRGQLVSSN